MSPSAELENVFPEMTHLRPCPFCGSADGFVKLVEPPFRILKCRSCSLVYLANPPDHDQMYEEYYESAEPEAQKYHDNSGDPALAELFAINTQRISRIKKIKPDGLLLDVGCGRGTFLKTARDHGFTVRGVDISERAIAYAQKEFGLKATVGSIDDLVKQDQRFDVITLWHVLEHFLDPLESLAQARSLLNNAGICVIEVPNLHSLKFILAKRKWEGGNHPLYHRTFFTALTLRRALLKAGFSDPRRLKLSYRIPQRSTMYEGFKAALNLVGMDAFLAFVARK